MHSLHNTETNTWSVGVGMYSLKGLVSWSYEVDVSSLEGQGGAEIAETSVKGEQKGG